MRLYHQPRTRSTRVLWLLEEIGAPFELTVISRDDKKADEYRRRHPLGRAPVVEFEAGPVFESAALILQIADLHPDAALIAPVGSHSRALQYQWCFFGMTELEAALVDIGRQLWRDDAEPHQDVIDGAKKRFADRVEVVASALGNREFLVDDSFSVADVVVGSVIAFGRTGELLELPPEIVPYVDLLEARPARQRAVAVAAPA